MECIKIETLQNYQSQNNGSTCFIRLARRLKSKQRKKPEIRGLWKKLQEKRRRKLRNLDERFSVK